MFITPHNCHNRWSCKNIQSSVKGSTRYVKEGAFNQTACVILQRWNNLTQFYSRFEFSNGSLICLDAWQLLSPIHALSSVKFPGLKLWLCKKDDKYEVTLFIKHQFFFNKALHGGS